MRKKEPESKSESDEEWGTVMCGICENVPASEDHFIHVHGYSLTGKYIVKNPNKIKMEELK